MVTAQKLLERFHNAKTLPHVAMRLSKLISDDNCTIDQLQEVIRLDPTLVLRLLRLINSPYYGLREKVDSISQAVVFLGMKNLRNMVVLEAMKEIFKEGKPGDVFSKNRLWLHCAAVSICGQMISERILAQNGEDVFLCGILHDIGMIVENQVEADAFIETCKTFVKGSKPFVEYEKEIIGIHHCSVGYRLANQWNLPLDVQEGIKNHHSVLETVSPSSITGIIQIAEYMVARLDYTALAGMKPILSPPLLVHIRDNISEYKTLMRDLPDEMLKARDIYEIQED